jgi:hypothetical protein
VRQSPLTDDPIDPIDPIGPDIDIESGSDIAGKEWLAECSTVPHRRTTR